MNAPPKLRVDPPPLPRRAGYTPPPVLPLEVGTLASLRTLPLRARWLAEAAGLGYHRSRNRGSNLEFAEYRDYQPGDDLRRIDWRLFARSDRLHVRRAYADTPLRITLLLDSSESMAFAGKAGRLSKLDYARSLLGAIALIARQQRDANGAGLLGDQLKHWLPPSSSRVRLDAVWALLDGPTVGGPTDLPKALEQVLAVAPRRCLFILASDFYLEPTQLAPSLLRLRSEGHELIVLRVLDPLEIDFEVNSAGKYFDIEADGAVDIDPAVVGPAYRAAFGKHAAALEETVISHGGDFVSLRTDSLPLEGLRSYLGRRNRRR